MLRDCTKGPACMRSIRSCIRYFLLTSVCRKDNVLHAKKRKKADNSDREPKSGFAAFLLFFESLPNQKKIYNFKIILKNQKK